MSFTEGARHFARKIVRFDIEPIGDAIKRSHREYEEIHREHDDVIAGAQFVERAEGELPEEIQKQIEASQDRYRYVRELEVSGRISRHAEVVLFDSKTFHFRKITQLPLLRRI